MDALSAFGLFAVTAMLVTYALEPRHRGFILAFAGACVMGSAYGFLQGAWPFGVVEAIWALVAVQRWLKVWSDCLYSAQEPLPERRTDRSTDPRTAQHHPKRSVSTQFAYCDTEGDLGAATARARAGALAAATALRAAEQGQMASPPRLTRTETLEA